jgi:AhpD family alkylhydroperoxidase
MNQRIDLPDLVPDSFKAVLRLQKHVDANVDRTVLHLVQLRASLLNGCSYCIDLHTREALAAGEDPRRLTGVAGWRESALYDQRERAALALTEVVTRLPSDGVPDEVWEPAVEHWSEEGAANLVLAIGTINLWNRLLITMRTPVAA